MKALLLFPPQWNPSSPHSALPLLKAQLSKNGYDETKIIDINNLFFDYILEQKHLKKCFDFSITEFKKLDEEVKEKYADRVENYNSYTDEIKIKLQRHKKMSEVLAFGNERLNKAINGINNAKAVLRKREEFYNPEKLFSAKKLINDALKIASMPYFPNEMIWDNYFFNPVLELEWKNIDFQCKDKQTNMFLEYFSDFVSETDFDDYDLVCISCPDLSQIISAFTLARLIKSKSNIHITIGGNYITQIEKALINHKEIFMEYADDFLIGDGEISIVELFDFISGKIGRNEVLSLIYYDGERVISNPKAPDFKIENTAYFNFDDYNFSAYFSPEPVLPIQLSKGCYWGKCNFCDYFYGQQCFDIKAPERVADEMRVYVQKYGANKFVIVDEAVPPKYYEKLADEILKLGLEVYFYSFARLEKGFTAEVLNKISKAGARMLMWGYEAQSKRVLDKMNKGVEYEYRMDILKNSREAGIWNNCLFMIGYPTETREEVEQTLKVMYENRDIINSSTPSNFSLKKNSRLVKTMENVRSYKDGGEFFVVLKDDIVGISQKGRREIRQQFNKKMQSEFSNKMWPVIYSEMDHLLLYLAKYGTDFVSSYSSETDICPKFNS